MSNENSMVMCVICSHPRNEHFYNGDGPMSYDPTYSKWCIKCAGDAIKNTKSVSNSKCKKFEDDEFAGVVERMREDAKD